MKDKLEDNTEFIPRSPLPDAGDALLLHLAAAYMGPFVL